MAGKDVRWIQRFENFEKAFVSLRVGLEKKELNELERNGLVQRFEFTLDLCWKILKDYLEDEGFQFKPSPKETIRQAYQSGYIKNAQALIDGINIRNELSHDYSGEKFKKAEPELREIVYPELAEVYSFFKSINSRQINLFDE